MLLTLDIGNTNIKTGLFDGEKLIHSWRLSMDLNKTADEYGMLFHSFFSYIGLSTEEVTGIIVSSVVPSIRYTIEHMCSLYLPVEPVFVGPGIKTGIRLCYNDPRELGADRICNAVGAYYKYGGPLIVVDFGTATSMSVVSASGDFEGGAICPGVKISMNALVENTVRLSTVELRKPPSPIGKSTVQCIQSGLLYGHAGQVDNIIEKFSEALGAEPKMIATGGMASYIVAESRYLDTIDSTLTLYGLMKIYGLNR